MVKVRAEDAGSRPLLSAPPPHAADKPPHGARGALPASGAPLPALWAAGQRPGAALSSPLPARRSRPPLVPQAPKAQPTGESLALQALANRFVLGCVEGAAEPSVTAVRLVSLVRARGEGRER